jgi:hypothetical protein
MLDLSAEPLELTFFSIVAAEWPSVRERLERFLSR